MKAFYYALKES